MKAIVNKETCIGCGLCTSVCSECFEMGDDGKAEFVVPEASKEAEDEVKEAAEGCPVAAISVEDE